MLENVGACRGLIKKNPILRTEECNAIRTEDQRSSFDLNTVVFATLSAAGGNFKFIVNLTRRRRHFRKIIVHVVGISGYVAPGRSKRGLFEELQCENGRPAPQEWNIGISGYPRSSVLSPL